MKIHEKYLEALKTFEDYVTVSEWAEKVGVMYPDLLKKANNEAEKQRHKTTGLRELSARIGSRISTGGYYGLVLVDASKAPREVKYINKDDLEVMTNQEVASDMDPITRKEIIYEAKSELELYELFRIDEYYDIQKSFKKWFDLDLEVDHSIALLNANKRGSHHADNLQLLFKYHNGKKSNSSWNRFTFTEQKEYILKVIEIHKLVASDSQLNIEINNNILKHLLNRLQKVY